MFFFVILSIYVPFSPFVETVPSCSPLPFPHPVYPAHLCSFSPHPAHLCPCFSHSWKHYLLAPPIPFPHPVYPAHLCSFLPIRGNITLLLPPYPFPILSILPIYVPFSPSCLSYPSMFPFPHSWKHSLLAPPIPFPHPVYPAHLCSFLPILP
ncbi:MAG: hypothetical protein RL076_1926, partial [Chloroflexota bacterium]